MVVYEMSCLFFLPPGHFHSHGYFVFDGNRQERGRVNLEIGELAWDGSGYPGFVSLGLLLEFNLIEGGGLSRKLDLQIGMDRG